MPCHTIRCCVPVLYSSNHTALATGLAHTGAQASEPIARASDTSIYGPLEKGSLTAANPPPQVLTPHSGSDPTAAGSQPFPATALPPLQVLTQSVPNTPHPKLLFLSHTVGLTTQQQAAMLPRQPNVLCLSLPLLHRNHSSRRALGFSHEEIRRMLVLFPTLLLLRAAAGRHTAAVTFQSTQKPNVLCLSLPLLHRNHSSLRALGFSPEDIRRMLVSKIAG
ncbi:unnamed protein product [Closterium sp. Naga37s-1]|nr:unnamed protein product [Closterium sp. Naga37s-1]